MSLDPGLIRKNFYWPSISNAFWVFMVSVVFAVSMLLISNTILATLKDKGRAEQSKLYGIQQAHSDTVKEIQLISDYIEPYSWLMKKGFIGNEDRLSRVEVIKHIRDSRQLPELGYTFDPAVEITEYHGLLVENMRIFSTPNTLSFTMHDETDLDLMLNQLEQRAQGIYLAESCTISRRSDELHLSTSGNIHGSCKLNWLSLKNMDADEGNSYE